jgi:hypothetical protein
MAVIHTYPTDTNISVNDLLIGADGDNNNITKKFTIGSLAVFLAETESVVDTNFYLDGVTINNTSGLVTFSMTGASDITLDLGTAALQDTSYFATANHTHQLSDIVSANDITSTYLNVAGNGTSGQILTSNGGGGFNWIDQSAITDANFYLDGITKSGNILTFSVNGATNQSFTFGEGAFLSLASIISQVESGIDFDNIVSELGALAHLNKVSQTEILENAVTEQKILDQAVTERKLNVTNTPTAGYVLTSDGDEGFTWTFNSASNYYVSNIAKSNNTLTFEMTGGLASSSWASYTFGGGAFKDIDTVTGRDANKVPPANHTHTIAHITNAGALAELATVDTAQIDDQAVTAIKLSPTVGTNGQILTVDGSGNLAWSTLSANVVNFLALGDTPASFGTAGQMLKVNSGANGLEFANFAITPADVTATTSPAANKVLAIDNNGDFEFRDEGTVTLANDSVTPAKISFIDDNTLASNAGELLISDGVDFGNVAVSGDLTITGAGVTTISADAVTATKIDFIDDSLSAATAGHILISDGTDFGNVAMSGDVTIDSAGATTIANDVIDHDQIANRFTASTTVNGGSGTKNLDASAASVFAFTSSISGTVTIVLQNMKVGQVIDIYNLTGIATLNIDTNFASAAINKVGGVDYDGSATNHMQVVCLNDATLAEVVNYTVATYTPDTSA